MNFDAYLKSRAGEINAALSAYMEKPAKPQKVIYDAMSYSLLASGKRIRPLITLLACEACGGDAGIVMPFACALEMIHAYSLIHDDLPAMDDDNLRRGKPTSHMVYGEAIAILAGDALLNKAFEVISEAEYPNIPAERILRATAVLSKASGADGMIGGQVVDVENEGKTIGAETLKYLHSLKTGALIRAAGVVGAIMAGASEERINAIDECCLNLGMAFQIQDDILDVTGSFEVLGKPIGSDEVNRKTTYISLFGQEKARELMLEYSDKAKNALDIFGGDAEMLIEIVKYLVVRKA